ncbi:hypothetical protein NIES267_57140 [Calothrix parasitica NIES-267]|uniref:Uncharacterized protein n=1 Tax=Calothrix parasitica NIES-267 TaxID=1973488 RepID=A0A1Z4LYL7_9CYAN|nr:hypothetical protein NIES267_57140 [Calothrix parasitica NIES-267]
MKNRPNYTDKYSTKTVQEGLEEYYKINSDLTNPNTQPDDFGKILLAHDVGHVIYGCDTDMYDELKLLPLSWWTSECTFKEYLKMRKNPAVDVMYEDLIKRHGVIWLYVSIILVLPRLLPELVSIWFKTRNRQNRVPFLEFESLLNRSLLDIRQELGILDLIE